MNDKPLEIIPCGDGGSGKIVSDDINYQNLDIEALREACADDCASLERQLEDRDAEIQTLQEALNINMAFREMDTKEIASLRAELRAEVERLERPHPYGKIINDRDNTILELSASIKDADRLLHQRAESIKEWAKKAVRLEDEVGRLRWALEKISALTDSCHCYRPGRSGQEAMTADLIDRLRATTLSTEDEVAPCSIRGDADLINEAADALEAIAPLREAYDDKQAIISQLHEDIAALRARVAELEGFIRNVALVFKRLGFDTQAIECRAFIAPHHSNQESADGNTE